MKILFFSTEIWSNSPEGIVVRKYLKGMLENNYEVDVVTNKKIKIDFFRGKYFIFDNYFNEFIDKVLKNILGLEKIGFILNFIKNYKRININNYDLIMVRSEPVSIHIISLFLKKNFPDKKIICSFSDIGYLNPYYSKKFFIKKQISKFIERFVFKKADMITHTNKFVFEKYLEKKIIKSENKNFILENPLELDKDNLKIKKQVKNQILNIGYIGSFYGKRSPEPVFSYIAKIDSEKKIKFFIFGGVRNIYYDKCLGKIGNYFMKKELNTIINLAKKYKIESQIIITPFLKQVELNKYIYENIDVLINVDAFTNEKNVFLSSKIVDYLKYNLPILNFSNEGASSEFLKKIGINYYIDYNKKEEFDILKDNLLFLVPDKNKILNFTSKNLIKKMVETLFNKKNGERHE